MPFKKWNRVFGGMCLVASCGAFAGTNTQVASAQGSVQTEQARLEAKEAQFQSTIPGSWVLEFSKGSESYQVFMTIAPSKGPHADLNEEVKEEGLRVSDKIFDVKITKSNNSYFKASDALSLSTFTYLDMVQILWIKNGHPTDSNQILEITSSTISLGGDQPSENQVGITMRRLP